MTRSNAQSKLRYVESGEHGIHLVHVAAVPAQPAGAPSGAGPRTRLRLIPRDFRGAAAQRKSTLALLTVRACVDSFVRHLPRF